MSALVAFVSPYLLKAALAVFLLLVAWLFLRLAAWAHHNAWLAKHERFLALIDAFSTAAQTAVRVIAQAYVDSLVTSGKFDKAAQEEAKRRAIETAKSQLGPSWNAMVKSQGEAKATAVLDQQIEAAVANQKMAKAFMAVPGLDRSA